jgi:biotin carboxylase
VAYNTTNKAARSGILCDAGIPIPQFEVRTDASPPTIPFPVVVKPSDNSGARGVQLIRTEEEWGAAYEEARTLSSDGKVIVEEFIKGDEISIEGFVLDGTLYIHGFSDRNFIPGYEPRFMEDGSTSPTLLPPAIVKEAKEVFARAVKALGITTGPSKGDLLVAKDGVKVLEITSRLSPLFPMTAPLTTGTDPLEAVVRWAAKMDIPQSILQPTLARASAHRYFFHTPGRITSIVGFDELPQQQGVRIVITLQPFAVGDVLSAPSFINRLFYIATVADDRETAVALAEKALQSVRVEVEPMTAT